MKQQPENAKFKHSKYAACLLFFQMSQIFLFISGCSSNQWDQSGCFKLESDPHFIFGQQVQVDSLSFIPYPFDTLDGFNELLEYSNGYMFLGLDPKYISVLMFTVEKETNKLNGIQAFWTLRESREVDLKRSLNLIREKYLPCLPVDVLDLKIGGYYGIRRGALAETFLLEKVQNPGQIDQWGLTYSMMDKR